jgi:hypothetical protein
MNPLIFIKFGDKTHIDALFQKGEIYMTPLLNFKKSNHNKQRFDKFEGNLSNHYSTNSKIQIKPTDESVWKDLHYTEAFYTTAISDKSILSYSLYAINQEDFLTDSIFSIDHKMKEFGNAFLIIRNTKEFIRRITNYFFENNMEYKFGYINYYERKLNHDLLGLFHKPSELSHQKEFRILSKNSAASPLKFSVGNLEDLAEIYSADSLESLRLRRPLK